MTAAIEKKGCAGSCVLPARSFSLDSISSKSDKPNIRLETVPVIKARESL